MSSNPNRPVMFPCATQVSLIQVGADDFELKVKDHLKYLRRGNGGQQLIKDPKNKDNVPKRILQSVSAGLSFTDEVVRDKAPYTIPYNEQSVYDAYDTSEFLSRAEKRMNLPGGRFNNYGPDRRHMSCHFKKTAPYKLKPIKREIMRRAIEMHKQALQQQEQKLAEGTTPDAKEPAGFFITETSAQQTHHPSPRRDVTETLPELPEEESAVEDSETKSLKTPGNEKHQWDEYLLSILSRPTAQWIVTQKTDPTDNRYRPLYDYMVCKHGAPTSTELVRDDMAEYEDQPEPVVVVEEAERRPNTQSARLLQRVHNLEEAEEDKELDTVPYSDQNRASFYRKPGGIKKRIKIQQKEMAGDTANIELDEEPGALNTTATSITVKKQELPPPPKLRDFVDPRITENTVYETDNNFQRDWLTGNKQVYQAFGEENEIVMENHNKYKKVSQVQYPRHSNEWCPDGSVQREGLNLASPNNLVHKLNKGQRRWTELPKPVELSMERIDEVMFPDDKKNESSGMIAGVVDDIEQSVNPSVEKFQPSEALSKIVDEWRSKWHLNMRFDDASPEELIKDMEDIHPHVRIKAISTCAKATAYRPPPLEGIQLFTVQRSQKSNLPEKIFVALDCLLDDEHPKVRLAAAISLHALQRPNEKAEEILRANLLPEQNKADRWAAVQCLGFYGITDSDVIGECIEQMMNNENMIQYEKACALLAHISNNTDEYGQNLVHSMLAEHLNDCSWRHRVITLKCLPKLYGDVNIDIQNKMMHLMWNDSHSDVRKAAAQSLGKCGYGRLVHDKMRQILIDGTQSERAETLSKIGFLGIMTAKLMLPFMRAFRDEYVAVRKEACIAAGNLCIKDDSLIAELLRLSNRDPIWRIKALAIQALGKIGVPTPEVREALLWALRFEEEEGVRAEACHSIVLLQLKDKEVLEILQNRMLVETEPVVQEELKVALEFNGVSSTEDMAMVAQIKAEVRKLSNRNDIYNSICVLEEEERLQENTKRMIYIPPMLKIPTLPAEELEIDMDDKLVVDQVAAQQTEQASYPRPHSHSMNTVSEPILEEDEDTPPGQEDKTTLMTTSRQQSARSSSHQLSRSTSRQPSGKSRPTSGGSSLNTEVLEKELEDVMGLKQPTKTDVTEPSESGMSQHSTRENRESRASSGYEKKKLSGLRAVSVTPTVLSMSLDQVEAIHSEDPSIVEKLRAMSLNEQETSKSHLGNIEQPSRDPSATTMAFEGGRDLYNIQGGNNFTKVNVETLDAMDVARLQCRDFLFDRYSHIDIKSPEAFSPLVSEH